MQRLFVLGLCLCSWTDACRDPSEDNFYYSNNVTEANDKFAKACRSARGTPEYFNHPEKGRYGEQLQAVVCVQGNVRSPSAIITISGTHGIEGYVGSMAQVSMFHMLTADLLAKIRVIQVHLINPYGASHILKENEQNADQYKNAAGYYTLSYDNPILEQLIDSIDLPHLWNETVQQAAFAAFGQLIGQHGEEAVNKALKTGQGKRPRGIAYFGPSKSWSTQILENIVDKYLNSTENVLLIDWHTAVGPYGNWTYLASDDQSQMAFRRWIPEGLTEWSDISVPAGGKFGYSLVQERTNARRFLWVAWEAGTYPVNPQVNANFFLRLFCRYYRDSTDPFCAQVISQTREYFYPQGADWKQATYTEINQLLPKVLAGFFAEANRGQTITGSVYWLIWILIISIEGLSFF